MHPQVTNLQFFAGGFALICVAVLALAAFLDFRRKRKSSPLNYYCNNFDPSEFDQDN